MCWWPWNCLGIFLYVRAGNGPASELSDIYGYVNKAHIMWVALAAGRWWRVCSQPASSRVGTQRVPKERRRLVLGRHSLHNVCHWSWEGLEECLLPKHSQGELLIFPHWLCYFLNVCLWDLLSATPPRTGLINECELWDYTQPALSQDGLQYMNTDIHQFGFQFSLHFSVWEKSDGRLDRKRRDLTGRKSAP